MIEALRRLFGRGPERPAAASLNDHLLVAVGKPPAGKVRAKARIRRRRMSVVERAPTPDAGQPSATLSAFLDAWAPRLGARGRERLFSLVQPAVVGDLGEPGGSALARSLMQLRDRLREPLPEPSGALDAPYRLIVDQAYAIDERSFWIFGWCRDDDGALAGCEVVSPEGQRAPLLHHAYRFSRPDVEEQYATTGIGTTSKHGFANLIELPHPSPLSEGWRTELRGTAVDFQWPVNPVIRDPAAARQHVLTEISLERPDVEDLRASHARPAIDRLQAFTRHSLAIEEVIQHGEPPPQPDVSIIVPLYGRIDLIEHQIAQFWNDPDLVAAELIYVLDSPELGPGLTHQCALLHDLYGLPFKTVHLNRNSGYATANNFGASVARGRLLLMLNSDVFPDRPGWLGHMRDFYDATENIGALGPKLLYEDGSIQHAGMYFQFDHRTRLWENQHYFKGFSRGLEPAAVSRRVPAVTGACLMVARDLYRQVGGLHEGYVQGGYEDSDLCLRLLEAGKRNWYQADVELFHLEAQSLPIEIRLANRYNAWLQTHLWSERIASVMVGQLEVPEPEVATFE